MLVSEHALSLRQACRTARLARSAYYALPRARDDGPNRLKKEVTLSPEFVELWNRIKPKTTYRVEFETDTLVSRAIESIRIWATNLPLCTKAPGSF